MRALIFSDIHANLDALEAVLAAAPQHDATWNLGDVVGYGGSPNEVIERVRSLPEITHVRGNHDKVCCGESSALSFNPIAREAAMWTQTILTEENNQWLHDLPHGPVDVEGRDATISHGSPLDEDLYILNIREAWPALQQMKTQITFFGHTHVQGGFGWNEGQWFEMKPQYQVSSGIASWVLPLVEGTHYLINPGSIGQPRDGDWRAAFCILDKAAQEITFYRVPYDLARAQGRILMAGLPERLAQRLRDGR